MVSRFPETDENSPPEVVVLLHGLGANSWLMWLLASRLKARGYAVVNWGYWSFRQSLDDLVPEIEERFRRLQEALPPRTPVRIVAHSLGAILVRAALSRIDFPMLKSVVLLSPPVRGSRVATWLAPCFYWVLPLVRDLSDLPDSCVNCHREEFPPGIPVGVIAASWDYVLQEESTHLPEETDHITLASRHSGLVLRRKVADQIIHFLKHGRFLRESSAVEPGPQLETSSQDS